MKLEEEAGLEPAHRLSSATDCLANSSLTFRVILPIVKLAGSTGLEPVMPVSKTGVLPTTPTPS